MANALVSYRAGPVTVLEEWDCPECSESHEWEICPMCGSDVFFSFGIGFGHYGMTVICESYCGWNHRVSTACVMCEDLVPEDRAVYCSAECETRAESTGSL